MFGQGEPSLQALQQWSSGVVLDGRPRPANVQCLNVIPPLLC